MNVNDILNERGSRYGNYLEQTKITFALMDIINGSLSERDKMLANDQSDAFYMMAVKISRIINGDPDYADNWRDIAGYATLVADRLEGKSR